MRNVVIRRKWCNSVSSESNYSKQGPLLKFVCRVVNVTERIAAADVICLLSSPCASYWSARFRSGRRGGERTSQDHYEQHRGGWKTLKRNTNDGSSARIRRANADPHTLPSIFDLRSRKSIGAREDARNEISAATFPVHQAFSAGSEYYICIWAMLF